MDDDPLARVRRLCLALPETTERLSHGSPTFFVRDKRVFVSYVGYHHGNDLAFWCHAPVGAQQALVQSDPRRFFVPPYVGGRGWIGVYLDVQGKPNDEAFWDEVAELVEDAYRMVAPRPLLAQLDAAR